MDSQAALQIQPKSYLEDAFEVLNTDQGILDAMRAVSTICGTKITVIKNDQQEVQYSEMLVQTRGILKDIDARRKGIVDPFNRAVKAVNDWIKKHFSEPISEKEREIQNAIKVYRIKKAEEAAKAQAKAEALQAKLQKQSDKAGVDTVIPQIVMPPPEKVTRTDSGQVHERKVLKLEVLDIKQLAQAVAEGKIPETAIEANMKTLRNLAQAGMDIPGVKWGYETELNVRRA